MNKDNRISNLFHTQKLSSDGLEPFPSSAKINTQGNKDDEVLFLISNSGQYNEKIQYKNLKSSILDNTMLLTGDQLISGEKNFADSCTFLDGVNVSGDAFLENVFIKSEDGEWNKVSRGSDESVSFVTPLAAGSDSYKIDFPKTFGEPPAVTLSLEVDGATKIIPYSISGVNTSEYYVNFDEALGSDAYKMHTSTRATGQSSTSKTTTQSFFTDLATGQDSYEINFPNTFHAAPTISNSLETEGPALLHLVSGVSENSFHILFGTQLKDPCRIHTHAVR